MNSLSQFRTLDEKRVAFRNAVAANEFAHCETGVPIPMRNVNINDVDFVGGLWRIQRIFPYTVQQVRDKRFVLFDQIERTEKNLFVYYRAASVYENCYGPIIGAPSHVVARYDTDNGPMWAYGDTIEAARAFLGIALFDKHIDLIHAAERRQIGYSR
ncbi:MAG: hypothetical protein IJ560_01870 [Alphaproteobacteria bacterium]|nr:hypothetical protein [Alphaproteobacteria bacterium]